MANNLRRIYTAPEDIRDQTEQSLVNGIKDQFPVENKRFRLEVSNIKVDRKDFNHKHEKDAILKSKSLTYPIKGDLTLYDKESGKVVDRARGFSLADSFALTDKHTMIYKGNNYSVSNLIQLLPGIYTRSKNTGELEANVNTGSGQNFSISLDPESQTFNARIGSSKVPIAPLMQDVLGVSKQEASKYVPGDVWEKSLQQSEGKEEKAINALYSRLVSKPQQNKNASLEDKKLALKQSIESQELHPKTTEITLGKSKSHIDSEALLQSMNNVYRVYRGDRKEDNRDSLEFKRVQSLPDFIKRRFDVNRRNESVSKAVNRLGFNLDKLEQDNPDLGKVVPSKPFNKVMSDFIIKSSLASTPEETNPIESLENVGKVTVIGPGEGGMRSPREATQESRNINASHLGVLDPSRTPESETAGLDQRFSIGAMRDDEGIMYARVKDKNGKMKSVSVQDMMKATVGFPNQDSNKKQVQAQVDGEIKEVPREQVDYWVPDGSDMYTVTTNLIPYLNSNHPGRLTMAGKAITQALSLKDREEPLVQTTNSEGRPFVEDLGKLVSTLSPTKGEVKKVTNSQIHIKSDEDGKTHKVDMVKNLPFNMKGFHDDEPTVKPGDRVNKDDVLADNNYTKNGKFALGRNLNVGYMPYKGYNHEDGIVVSQRAANRLRSNHSSKFDYSVKQNTVANKRMFNRYFSGAFTQEQLDKLDEKGYAREGVKLEYGDPVIAVLEKRELSEHDKTFGNLHKTLVNPYDKVVKTWESEEVGKVVDAHTDSKEVRILVRSEKPLEVGDKLTGLHGNKGVVSAILEDEDMPHSKEENEPFDALLNPASVTSRVNLGQIMETAAGKIAKKEGKPFKVRNYEKENNLQDLKKKLQEKGLKDTDMAVDPKDGKEFGEIMAGPQYFLKLHKTTESNYSARNVGGYDAFRQPVKGGYEGAKKVGFMEYLGLLGSDARKNLKEMGTVKSEENTEFWDKFMRGEPLPKPKTTFATNKFFDTLRGAGVQVQFKDDKIQARPMTDQDILSMSRGEIKDATMIDAKSGAPDKGGLFDIGVTGGFKGKDWAHYPLAEPIVNPIFEKPVKSILGLTGKEFDGLVSGSLQVKKKEPGVFNLLDSNTGNIKRTIEISQSEAAKLKGSGIHKQAAPHSLEEVVEALDEEEGSVGGNAFDEILNDMDVDKELDRTKKQYHETKSKTKKDEMVKKMKYLEGLRKEGYKKPGDAYMMRNMPVLPPVMRPVVDQGANKMEFSDVNRFYRDHLILNNSFKEVKDRLPPEMLTKERHDFYKGSKAIAGLGEAIDPQTKQKGLKGLLTQVSGSTGPKHGMFQDKLLSKKQDFSGRVTISAAPEVGFNEANIPKDQMWTMFKMHIIRDLVKNGYRYPEAKKAYEEKNQAAMNSFEKLRKHVPVVINRAPTLMRTNTMGVYGNPIEGKTLGLNILHLPGFAADFDGDAMSMYLPQTEEAIQETKDKMLPQHHINDARRGFGVPMFTPGHEAILGSVHLTEPDPDQPTVEFKSEREALNALKKGEIKENTPIKIKEK